MARDVHPKDKLYFDPKTPPAVVVQYMLRLAAGETAEEIRAKDRAAEEKAAKGAPSPESDDGTSGCQGPKK